MTSLALKFQENCPDCKMDPDHEEYHAEGCPRIDTVGQIGPPWLPPPWKKWCHKGNRPCMKAEGHPGRCDRNT